MSQKLLRSYPAWHRKLWYNMPWQIPFAIVVIILIAVWFHLGYGER